MQPELLLNQSSFNMKTYLGTKVVKALPMNRQKYNDYRGWKLPDGEDGSDEGMLVEYTDGGKSNHPDHEGYISWSPLDVFSNAYREIGGGLTFGDALELLKSGKRVARIGWNGKDQYVFLIEGSEYQKSLRWGFGEYVGEPTIQSSLAIKTTANQVQVGWLASQSDMLSEDWVLVN